MRISIGSDHRGVQAKGRLVGALRELGYNVNDEGAHDGQTVDYPDFAASVAEKVSLGDVDRGILICGTGIGMSIAANKFPGVRAAPCNDEFLAEMCRRHNDVNVLCLSADRLNDAQLTNIVRVWLETPFESGRHARRVDKIRTLEERFGKRQ